jgi:hypothetical protein
MRLGIWKSQHFGGGVFTVLIIVDSSSLNHKVTNLSERASGMFVRNFLHYWKASMCRYDLYIKDVSLCEQEKAGGKRKEISTELYHCAVKALAIGQHLVLQQTTKEKKQRK